MEFSISQDQLQWFAVSLFRILFLFQLVKFVFANAVPTRILVLLALAIALLSVLSIDVASIANSSLLELIINELVAAFSFGVGLLLIFAIFHIAGAMIDNQIGFALSASFDPATNSVNSIFSKAYSWVVIMFFWLTDLAKLTFSVAMLGSMSFENNMVGPIDLGAKMFLWGVLVAFPIVSLLLLVDVVVIFLVRSMPQINVFLVSFPLKIFIGIIMSMLSVIYLKESLTKVAVEIYGLQFF